MFGFIYMLYNTIGGLISCTKTSIENEQAKQRGRVRQALGQNDFGFYYDNKGNKRLLSSNEYADIRYDYMTGDAWLYIGLPGEPVKNVSAEWRKEYHNRCKENAVDGKTVTNDIQVRRGMRKDDMYFRNHGWNTKYYAYGQWFKDLKTGTIYVCRWYQNYAFYMNVRTGKLVRLTDEAIAAGNNDMTKIANIIRDYNKSVVKPNENDQKYKWDTFYMNNAIGRDGYKELEMMGQSQPKLCI